MTQYFHTHIQYPADGGEPTVTTTSWAAADFALAIAEKEAEITNRRLREAVLTLEGAAWLAAQEADIATLRAAMAAL